MKKIVLIIFMLVFALCICSCDNSTNNNDDDKKQDSSLDGIDLSLYEMPQTEFLQDGHTLTRLEEVMKFVIFEGTFIYERHLNSIGYRYILEETEDSMLYAYYWIDELRLVHLTMVEKVAHMSYIKIPVSLAKWVQSYTCLQMAETSPLFSEPTMCQTSRVLETAPQRHGT